MKNTIKLLGLLAMITPLVFAGCALFQNIRSPDGIHSVIPGGQLQLKISGQNKLEDITVSSTRDGKGYVAAGTSISTDGLLKIGPRETPKVLFVIATFPKGLVRVLQIRVVTIDKVEISPNDGTAVASRSFEFTALVEGTNEPDDDVIWKVSSNVDGSGSPTAGTTINRNGVLNVVKTEKFDTLYITAISVVDKSKSATVPVKIVVPTVESVTVSPESPIITRGESLQFRVAITGEYDPDQTVTWKVSTNADGTGTPTQGTGINTRGVLTVAKEEAASTLYIIATSTFDPAMSGRTVISDIRNEHVHNFAGKLNKAITDINKIELTQVCAQDPTHIGETITVTFAEYLAANAGTSEEPLALAFALNLGNTSQATSLWREQLLPALATANQFVSLDLSACTMDNATFNTGTPGNATKSTVPPVMNKIVSVSLPTTTTAIGASAFKESALRQITLPAGLTAINTEAFYNCRDLEKLDLPSGLTTIQGSAFWGASKLKTITIPAGVTTINGGILCQATNLEQLILMKPEPPTLALSLWLVMSTTSKARIMVPAGSVEAYKTGQGLDQANKDRWARYLDKVHAIGCNSLVPHEGDSCK